jgi:hypothetical protein
MNKQINDLMYNAGLTADGCWNQMDDYDREAVLKFAELIVLKCLTIVERQEYSYHEADPLHETAELIRDYFGIEE